MKKYYKVDKWRVIEEGFNPQMQEASESIFSLGNGLMGQRANFEEKYTGESLQGTYLAGVYYPDKTRVGWWKNGYPEYFAKVLNAPSWIDILISVDGEELDLATAKVTEFRRELNMQHGYLQRSFTAELPSSKKVKVEAKRFLSIYDEEIGAIKYFVTALNFKGKVEVDIRLNGDVLNADSNYDEQFWSVKTTFSDKYKSYLHAETLKSGFQTAMCSKHQITLNGDEIKYESNSYRTEKQCGNKIKVDVNVNDTVEIYKYVSVLTSLNYSEKDIVSAACAKAVEVFNVKFDTLFKAHKAVWEEKWKHSDIVIDGDEEAQQGIRFNIFQLNQTYNGKDDRLNIGPKGFTGEKYGGSTYWDTEAYLIPFYLSTAPERVSKKLLVYRYKHLQKAIENAQKLGFNNGAALFPMVTINGEECHNEWEITFEEIHRNGAIAYAINNYIDYTGDKSYLAEYGLEVLIGISRFWRQRVNWSDVKGRYVMLGVTGPNEYENNVNNNWYTNKLAVWTLQYTIEAIQYVMDEYPADYERICKTTGFKYKPETSEWKDVIENMFFPISEEQGVFLQQEGFMDKEQLLVSQLNPEERPINQHWSWDRILRSVFIKQADVLQGIFLFEDEFDVSTIERNFNFYEQRTVHESSLSPCIHSILANRIGNYDKAYELYLRTSRLDLDDYNCEVSEGLHITSMGGTWMSIVIGFGGLRIVDDKLSLSPNLPKQWNGLAFNINFRGRVLKVKISDTQTQVTLLEGEELSIMVNNKPFLLTASEDLVAV